MKKILVLMFAVLMAVPAFSQLKFGVKAGASTDFTFTKQTISAGTNTKVVVENAKNAEWGFQGGVFMRASMLGLYVQPELLFATATNSTQYSGTINGTTVNQIVSQKFNKVNIPVMVGFKVSMLRVNVGPVASFLINNPKELVDGETYKKATFGYQAGIGVDLFKKITLDARYEGNLNQFGNKVTIGGTDYTLDDRTGALILSVGLIF
jgi:opacity protein-like surface antigen